MDVILIIAVVFIAILFLVSISLGLWLWVTYNRLVRLRNQVTTSWAQVQTELERRLDLIPNLVATVKGYAEHERETLESVISARATAMKTDTREASLQSGDVLTAALGKLFALSERYPELKADSGFLELQREISQTENRISYGRKVFNETVQFYNTAQQVFPANLVAGRFKHSESASYSASENSMRPPTVSF